MTDPSPAACRPLEHAVILHTEHGSVEVLTPAEAESLAAALLLAADAAKRYREPKRTPFGRVRPKRKPQRRA